VALGHAATAQRLVVVPTIRPPAQVVVVVVVVAVEPRAPAPVSG